MSVLRRRDSGGGGSGEDLVPVLCALMRKYPSVWEHLTLGKYPDGAVRVCSTLTVFCDGGVLKACLNDRDQTLTAWVSAASLTGLLEALEAGLTGDSLDWRRPSGSMRKKR